MEKHQMVQLYFKHDMIHYFIAALRRTQVQVAEIDPLFSQCWKWPVALWPNAFKFCLGPPEITNLWTLVA